MYVGFKYVNAGYDHCHNNYVSTFLLDLLKSLTQSYTMYSICYD